MKSYRISHYLGTRTVEFFVKANDKEEAYKQFEKFKGKHQFILKIEETSEKEYMERVNETEIINITTTELFELLYKNSALTVTGYPYEDIYKFIDKVNNYISPATLDKIYVFTGKEFNNNYELISLFFDDGFPPICPDGYSEDVLFFSVILENPMSCYKLWGGRWFDDIVDNVFHK